MLNDIDIAVGLWDNSSSRVNYYRVLMHVVHCREETLNIMLGCIDVFDMYHDVVVVDEINKLQPE